MSRPFHLDTLHVGQLPGIETAFTLPPLSPGLNLLFGPNASGKSSVLRAINAALWPSAQSQRDVSVTATARDGEDRWRIHLDAGVTAVTRDGVAASVLELPVPTLQHRYTLALHDLLAATEAGADFAAAIARASVGGLDLSGAAEAAGFTDKPSRSATARTERDAAHTARREALQQQQALHQESERLADLEARVAAANAARHEAELWRAAERWIVARDAAHSAQAELAERPAALAALDGSEAEAAQALGDEWRRNRNDLERELLRLETADAAARDAFSGAVPDAAAREQWRAWCASCREAEDAVHAAESSRDGAAARERELHGALGDTERSTAATLTTATIAEFSAFARDAVATHAAWSLARKQYAQLDAMPVSGLPEQFSEQARDAIRLLTRWLSVAEREEQPHAPSDSSTGVSGVDADVLLVTTAPQPAFWLLLLVAVAGWGVAGALWHPIAWLGVLLTLLAAWWQWRASRAVARRALVTAQQRFQDAVRASERAATQRTEQARAAIEREYETIQLPSVPKWTAESVQVQLTALTRDLVRSERDVQHAHALSAALERQTAAEHELRLTAERRAALVDAYGVAPDMDGGTLVWFVERLSRWHDARLAHQAAQAQVETATSQRQQALDALGSLCAPFGTPVADSTTEAEARVALLESRYEAHREAARERDAARLEVERVREAAASIERAWQAVVTRAAIPSASLPASLNAEGEQALRDVVARLAALAQQRPAWLSLTQQVSDAERDMVQAESLAGEVRARSRDTAQPMLLDATPESWSQHSLHDVRDALAEAEARAASHQSLVEELTTLRHRMADATDADTVERALERVDRAEAGLAEQFADSVHAMVGHALTEHVRTVSRDVDRPRVFHRARTLFARFTHGEWQLQIDDASDRDAVFSAVESRTGRPVALANLSGGTRVQLLVAVRVAFVEHEEQEWKLPLLLDETLGTTDDARAHAFMDAMLSLAADGRQLFYCTAQQDEVEHWRSALAARANGPEAVPCQEIDLAAVRALPVGDKAATARSTRALAPSAITAPIPDVGKHSHTSYGNALRVRPIVPGTTPVGDTHLWYLFEALPVLRAAMLTGTDAWGPLSFYLQQGGALRVPDMDAATVQRQLARAEQLVRAIEILHRESAIGVSRPITRRALLESPLSEQQRESVGTLADRCDGNPTVLLQQLEDKALAGFGVRRIETLRDWMLQTGVLDERARRSPAEVRMAMLANTDGALDTAAVDALLNRIAVRAGELSRDDPSDELHGRGASGAPTPQLEAFQSGTDEAGHAD